MTNIDNELREIAQGVGRKKLNGGESEETTNYNFVHLGRQVAAAMVKAAEDQVEAAQAILDQTRKDAEELLATVTDKDRELADMTNRIAGLGEKVLEANRAFHAATGVYPVSRGDDSPA